MDDLSENSIENVVTKIFENIDKGSDRIHIDSFLGLVSFFIQPNTAEFFALKEIIRSISTDGMISESQTKLALVKLTKKLSKESDASPSFDIKSNFPYIENSDPKSYTNYLSPDHQEQRIDMLENEVADREHVIANLKKQLNSVILQAQIHEEANNILELDKQKLEEKLNRIQNNHTSLLNIQEEYDELKNTNQMLRDSNICLEEKVECLKTEIALLHNDFDLLSEEKQKLLQNLSESEDEIKSNLDKLTKAGNQIEHFKTQTAELFEEISRKEVMIKNLIAENVDLKMRNEFNSPGQKSFSSIGAEKHSLVSITPRNNESLMDELNNVDSFVDDEQMKKVEVMFQFFSSNTVMSPELNVYSESASTQRSCESYFNIISQLEEELEVQRKTNDRIMESLEVKTKESMLLMTEIENLNKLICNMKNCLHVSKMYCHCMHNALKDMKTGMKVLLFLMKRNCSFVEKQHDSILARVLKMSERMPPIEMAIVKREETQEESYADENLKLETHHFRSKSSFGLFFQTVVMLMFLLLLCNTVFYFSFPRKFFRICSYSWDWSRFEEILCLIFKVERVGVIPT